MLVTPANVQDKTGLRWLLAEWGPFLRRLRVVWADGAYLSETLAAWLLARFGWDLIITHPPIASRGFAVAPRRWMVGISLAYLLLGILAFSLGESSARRQGSLGRY